MGNLLRLGRLLLLGAVAAGVVRAADPFLTVRDIFPPEAWHNHSSCLVETRRGDLLVCWFHGSGERKADDVRVEGARLRRGRGEWSPRFLMADTPGYPDTNPCMVIDAEERLWLIYPTILANLWESALLKCRVSRDYHRPGPPRWERSDVVHITPGPEFDEAVREALPRLQAEAARADWTESTRREVADYLAAMEARAGDKLYRRLGRMPRARPFLGRNGRILVPLYHDGFSFSLMAWTDDAGAHWSTGRPVIGGGNIQPSIVRRSDGSLYTVMRDNGPQPKRLIEAVSHDEGARWTGVRDSAIPNPGSGADLIALRDGRWVFVGNDTEEGRHRLAVWLSADEGRTWPWRRALEDGPPGSGSHGYPSVLQSRDGSLHVSYSWHTRDADREAKTIRHAHFNPEWIGAGGEGR